MANSYTILKDVAALSEGRVQLSTGTLYGALKRLLGQEWIQRVFDAEVARLESLLAAADLRASEARA